MISPENRPGASLDPTFRIFARMISALVLGISLLVMLGWFMGIQPLIQIHPNWASMKFNNALCLAVEALAIGVWTWDSSITRRFQVSAGIFVLIVSVLTLCEYAIGTRTGIDQLFVLDASQVKTSSPGRMSIITAVCHLLLGLTLIARYRFFPLWIRRARHFLPPMVLSLGAAGLLGYAFGIEQSHGWGGLTRMAFHTALCIFLLGLAIIGTPYSGALEAGKERWRLAPYLAGGWFLVALVTSTLVMHAEQSVAAHVAQEENWIRSTAQNGLGNTVRAMKRLEVRELENHQAGRMPDSVDIGNHLRDFPEILWIAVPRALYSRDSEGVRTMDIPKMAIHEFRTGDFGYALDLRGFFPDIPGPHGDLNRILFAYPESGIPLSGSLVSSFPFADRMAILDLSGAADSRNLLNRRAYFVISIIGLLLLIFTWLSLRMGAKAEAKSDEVSAAHEKLGEFTRELERSNADLEQFVFIASHDLQTPLRHISGFVKLLLEKSEGEKDGQSHEYGRYISEAVERMQNLITGVLDLSRVERVPQAPHSINLEDLIARNVRNLEIELRAVEGVVHVSPGLPIVRGNAIRLSQLFDNLLLNSIKYRNKSRPLRVLVSARQSDGNWILLLEDNGMGIKPEYREKVFQMFQRLHSQSEIKGTGIGLTLCRRIVEQHQGKIKLNESSLGGVAVCIEFPEAMESHA